MEPWTFGPVQKITLAGNRFPARVRRLLSQRFALLRAASGSRLAASCARSAAARVGLAAGFVFRAASPAFLAAVRLGRRATGVRATVAARQLQRAAIAGAGHGMTGTSGGGQ